MPSLRPLSVAIACALCALLNLDVLQAATRVELPIDELREKRSVPWPVTTGVPFARGTLVNAQTCRLVDDRGDEQPLQVKVAATWDAARTSIRWLTINFVAHPQRKYALEFGADVEPKKFPDLLRVTEGPDVVVDTGRLQAAFSSTKPAVIQSIRVDLNNDGTIGDDEQVAAGAGNGDHQYRDDRDRIWSADRDAEARQIVVESKGPVRACIRVDGWYTGPQGERIVRYRSRYHLFRGLPIIKLVDEFRIVGSTKDRKFKDIALPLTVQLGEDVLAVSAIDGNRAVSQSALGADDVASLRQETYRHYGNLECRAKHDVANSKSDVARDAAVGERAGSWMQLRGSRANVTGSLRWFWQQFPKEWTGRRDGLTLHLWSPHATPLDFGEAGIRDFFGPAGEKYLLGWNSKSGSTPITDFFYYAGRHALKRDGGNGLGINKHHEVWFHFGRPDESDVGLEYADLADRQPLCLPPGRWNVDSGVFGPLAARPNDSPYEAIVDRIFDLERYAQDTFGDYGWWLFGAGPHYSYQWDAETKRHVADPRRFEYHTYQRETQLWWNYLRSGERKFYDWAIPSENHWVDVAVAHVPTKYSSEWRGGTRQEATLHYVAGDWSIDSPLHYVRHHDTGEAWLRSAPQLWASYHRTLETTTLAYFLTGDERYQDVVEFWKEYWGTLAGVRSDSHDVAPWYQEQLWWQSTKPGEPTKTWAEMIRDYAPFQSGSRHQMTLFFNLSTLYEHTWDPKVGQAVREFADAYLAPSNPNGVWQCQDHRLPANADSPMLAHYWSSALWKYDRATNDPRMPDVLKKYFQACIEADPYGEDVGIYSNVQIAWAWHFTKDPRHLAAAAHELKELLPHAAPLDRPEDLGRRIYNPYAPIKTLAAVPRLIGILDEARRLGVSVPQPPVISPQRTWLAIPRSTDEPTRGTLWGWDAQPKILNEMGTPVGQITASVTHRSHRQPFDRVVPNYSVFRNAFTVDPASASAWCFVRPQLETGVLELSPAKPIWCWAGSPIQVQPREVWYWRRSAERAELVMESALPGLWTVRFHDRELSKRVEKNRVVFALSEIPADAVLAISTTAEQGAWFRLADTTVEAAWICPTHPGAAHAPPAPPGPELDTKPTDVANSSPFTDGRFGQGLIIDSRRELQIPDEVTTPSGETVRLTDVRQGTIEFWIRRLWDQRLTPVSMPTVFSAGAVSAPLPSFLPLNEWAHVAVVWRPIPNDEQERSLVHVYVDGVDYGNYRSIYWQGYSQPPTFQLQKPRLKSFSTRCPPGITFAIDDIRFSATPRYLDAALEFGKGQTFNSFQFTPPKEPLAVDAQTTLYLPFDGDLRDRGSHAVEASLGVKKP